MKPIEGDSQEPRLTPDEGGSTRRQFFDNLRGATSLALASTAAFGASNTALADGSPSLGGSKARAQAAFEVREKAALSNRLLPIPKQTPNQDEQLYPNFIGNYTKGLPHNPIGEVVPSAYRGLLRALDAGSAEAFERLVPLGGTVKLGNPLSGLAFELEALIHINWRSPQCPRSRARSAPPRRSSSTGWRCCAM